MFITPLGCTREAGTSYSITTLKNPCLKGGDIKALQKRTKYVIYHVLISVGRLHPVLVLVLASKISGSEKDLTVFISNSMFTWNSRLRLLQKTQKNNYPQLCIKVRSHTS